MKDAIKKANGVIKQLQRQRQEWMNEQMKDQADLKKLLEQKDALENEIQLKYDEISVENQRQLIQFDQLIREAEASRDKLLA